MFATAVPDPIEELEAGIRCEKQGVLDDALRHFGAAASSSLDPAVRSEALRRASFVHCTRCEWKLAIDRAREAAAIARQARAGQTGGSAAQVAAAAVLADLEAEALNAEAAVQQSRGKFAEAIPLLERSLALASGDRIRGIVLQNLGAVAAQQGDLRSAETHFLESSRCLKRAGYRWGEVFAINNYGAVALDRGDHAQAARILRDAVAGAREIGDMDLLGIATMNLAEAQTGLRDFAKAELLATAALGYFATANNGRRRVECLMLLGRLGEARGNRATALGCYERALALAHEIGAQGPVPKLEAALRDLREGIRERPLTPESTRVVPDPADGQRAEGGDWSAT